MATTWTVVMAGQGWAQEEHPRAIAAVQKEAAMVKWQYRIAPDRRYGRETSTQADGQGEPR
jgi:hypothetical protein